MNENVRAELKSVVEKLNGSMDELYTADHTGRTSRKIVIEYDIQEKS